MAHPKVKRFYANLRTHWPELAACAHLEVMKCYGDYQDGQLWIVTLQLEMHPPLWQFTSDRLVTTAIDEAEAEAEDEAFAALWEHILVKGKNFMTCSRASCKLCAILGLDEQKNKDGRAVELRQRIARLAAEQLLLQEQLRALEDANKK